MGRPLGVLSRDGQPLGQPLFQQRLGKRFG